MSVEVEDQQKVKPEPVPLYRGESQQRLKKRRFLDRLAKWIVAFGGFSIIASILAILLFIVVEILPLFRSAKVTKAQVYASNKIMPPQLRVVAVGEDENQEVGYLVSETGKVQFFSVANGRPRESFTIDGIGDEKITSVWTAINDATLVLGTNRGHVIEVNIDYNSRFYEGKRTYNPSISVSPVFTVDPDGSALTQLAFAGNADGAMAVAALTDDGELKIFLRKQEESFLGEVEIDSVRYELDKIWSGSPLSLALDRDIRNLYIGSDDGKIYHWRLSEEAPPKFVSVAHAATGNRVGITQLTFLLGYRTLMVGDSQGNLSAWFLVRDSTSTVGWRLTKIREMAPQGSAITAIVPSARGKGFIAGDMQGGLTLQYSTSDRLLARFSNTGDSKIALVSYAPKADGALTVGSDGSLVHWRIDNPHPEASWKAFFGKVWYEGYPKPEYVWQSTGGSDEFEPKLSLVPLIFGSLKGTLYALIFAVPLAIFGALYTSQFMHPTLKNKIKPSIEIMAALPSVVLGFLAGLWLAPRIEKVVPAVFCMLIVLPILILFSTFVWRRIPQKFRGRFRPGIESLLLIPVVVFGIWFCLEINGFVEQILFGGEFKVWLYQNLNLKYDQRNALVVGFAMGFAVIPIIYTISEDALSNVPRNLISGSLALGATRWQTAIRVVIPTAAAGIFSAVMIGFGRAVGETMIVLMATGNTPIMDWNIFNGFRTLSANIAVEIPEAPMGGTLYRVLFLAAFLLFVITFLVNTLADVVRQRLRERYQKL